MRHRTDGHRKRTQIFTDGDQFETDCVSQNLTNGLSCTPDNSKVMNLHNLTYIAINNDKQRTLVCNSIYLLLMRMLLYCRSIVSDYKTFLLDHV